VSSPMGMSEADWEALAMDTLRELAWQPLEGKKIAPGAGERESWNELGRPCACTCLITAGCRRWAGRAGRSSLCIHDLAVE
jgi:hypothetical protein